MHENVAEQAATSAGEICRTVADVKALPKQMVPPQMETCHSTRAKADLLEDIESGAW